ncbi:cytochrome P450 [Amycolatopsis palatopharyngis]|uniref:cytochrome P450 n=1 Tax=Amycolatopsis palatopharyngis TaxID=187982 RepID=UPI000E26949B|nr:cytochrome P450 [Amycolatopsis palatopharyngis]
MTAAGAVRFPRPLTPAGAPAPQLLELARQRPVLRVVGPGGGAAWLVAGDAEVREVLADAARFTSVTDPGVDERAGSAALMVGMDPPEHSRLRKLVVKAFSARRIQAMVPEIERIVAGLLDEMTASGPPADLVTSLSLPLPLAVIGRILDIPEADHGRLHEWSSVFISLTAHTSEEITTALEQMNSYIADLVRERRAVPGNDLVSDLIRARDGRDALSESELAGTILLLVLAGHETTAKAITRAGVVLGPSGALRQVAEGHVPAAQVVEEVLRCQSPIDTGLFRWAKVDTVLAGVQIKAGEQIFVSLQLANLDPSARVEPDRFDPSRPDARHLTFGHGIHLCLGAALARAELTTVVSALARRLPGLRPAVPVEELCWSVGAMLNAPVSLPVTW